MKETQTITRLELQGKRVLRVAVWLGEEAWATLDAETAVRQGLARGQVLNAARREAILAADEAIRARKAAAGSIARSPKTARETQTYLRGRKFSEAAVQAAVATLRDSGTIDDERVIGRYVAKRRRKSDLGPARLAAELRARGVEGEEAKRRVREAVEGVDLAKECLELARKLANKYAPLAEPRKRANFTAALLRRGYESDHAREAVRRVASEQGTETDD